MSVTKPSLLKMKVSRGGSTTITPFRGGDGCIPLSPHASEAIKTRKNPAICRGNEGIKPFSESYFYAAKHCDLQGK